MLTRINPQIAKEKQQEKDISNLKSEVSGMKGTLSNIESMLSKALSGNNFKSNCYGIYGRNYGKQVR